MTQRLFTCHVRVCLIILFHKKSLVTMSIMHVETFYHELSLNLSLLNDFSDKHHCSFCLFHLTMTFFFLSFCTVNAEVVLKATNVDGVYDADPKRNPNARLLEAVSYHEMQTRDLSVMDMTAITLCQENNIPGKERAVSF